MVETSEERTVSWRELLRETESLLASLAHVERPRLEARWMIEELVDGDGDGDGEGAGFAVALDQPARVRGVARLDSMVERRAAGEPIQYVLGHWAFRSLDLMVDRRVLIPRPETEIVAGVAMAELDRTTAREPGVLVDLGTGSGAIGLSVAVERPGTHVVLTDADDDALAVARANTVGLGTIDSTIAIYSGSWFDALPAELLGECSVLVSNPPYVAAEDVLPPAVEEWEPVAALRAGSAGLDDIAVLVEGARRWLRPNGALVVEIDPSQAERVVEDARNHGFDTEVRADLADRDRAVIARPRP